jgi:hypothetical protein
MGIKDILNKPGIQPRDLGHVGAEKATEVMHEAASVDDRIVTNPEADEEQPDTAKKTVKKEGIVSVNGEDVDRTSVEIEKDKAA